MEKIQLKPFYWDSKDWIGVPTNYQQSVFFKKVDGIKWNSALRCWYLPCDRKSYELLKKAVEGEVELDITLLKSYLQQRKVMLVEQPQKINRLTMQMMIQHSLNQSNLEALAAYKNLFAGELAAFSAIAKAHWCFYRWMISGPKPQKIEILNKKLIEGKWRGLIIWEYYIKKKKLFSQVLGNKK